MSACAPDHRLEQLLGAQSLLHVDLVAGLGQQVEPALRDLLRYQYPCHRGGLLTPPADEVGQSCASPKSAANRLTPSTRSSSPSA